MDILLAIVIGAAFGAVLDRIGATSPNWIGGMLTLRRLHLMKTIPLAIGTGSILMFGGQMLGLLDVGHMSVKTAYVGVFIGWLLGAAAYMATYPAWKSSGLLKAIAGGPATLGTVPGTDYPGLTGLPGDILGIVIGAVFVLVAALLPSSLTGSDDRAHVPAE